MRIGAYEFQTPGPFIETIPEVILTGDKFNITGLNFTAGSEVNLFIATAAGVISGGPLIPIARSLPTQLTVSVSSVSLGNGFVAVQVVNTDTGYLSLQFCSSLAPGRSRNRLSDHHQHQRPRLGHHQ